MRIVPARNVLPLIGIAALVLVAATGSTLAKKARASAYAENVKSAHYYAARDWKRHHSAYAVFRDFFPFLSATSEVCGADEKSLKSLVFVGCGGWRRNHPRSRPQAQV